MDKLDQWAAQFKALSEPLRIRLLMLLANGQDICVCDLVEILGVSQSMVSRHLAYLRNAGWVESRRQGVWMHYRLSSHPDPLRDAMLNALADQADTVQELMDDRTRATGSPCSGASCC